MRAIAAVAMAAPLALFTWHWLALIPALFLGWSVSGWGAFQGMRVVSDDPKNPLALLIRKLGMTGLGGCILGMTISGLICVAPSALIVGLLGWTWYPAALILVSALAFPLAYFLAVRCWVGAPLGVFASMGSTQWGEILVGASVGATIFWSLIA